MNNLQCRKAYVRVNLDVDEEGTIIPMLIRWKDGRVFQIEQLKYNCIGALFIPDTEPLPVPNVTVNTRRGVYVTYEPAQNE